MLVKVNGRRMRTPPLAVIFQIWVLGPPAGLPAFFLAAASLGFAVLSGLRSGIPAGRQIRTSSSHSEIPGRARAHAAPSKIEIGVA